MGEHFVRYIFYRERPNDVLWAEDMIETLVSPYGTVLLGMPDFSVLLGSILVEIFLVKYANKAGGHTISNAIHSLS